FNEAEVKAWLQDRELGIIDDPKEFDMDRELEPLEGIFDEGPGQEREGPEQVQEQQHAMPAPSIPEPEISGPSWER
ncbi:MAG TPA: hypothetical protein PKK12_09170, partial [Candidatus Aminicenantes bacterium]|nr:hypothetical protein [Candidatus Aminicenantes bacterium]